jgi:hypothetical protein
MCRLEAVMRAAETDPATIPAAARVDTAFKVVRGRHQKANVDALSKVFRAMQTDAQARRDAGAKVLVGPRWAGELKAVVFARNKATAAEIAQRVVKSLRATRVLQDDEEYDPDYMDEWLDINAGFAGDGIAQNTADQLTAATADPANTDPVSGVFLAILAAGVAEIAQRMVTTASGFAASDAAQAVGAGTKEWQVNNSNPRQSHAAMDGEIAALGEPFSNGMMWPGDPEGGPDETCGCDCSVTIIK